MEMIHALSAQFDFAFLDENNKPFYCYDWNGEKWLFYWHKDNHWVSLRPVNDQDIFPLNLSTLEQQTYHSLHAEWEALQQNIIVTKIQELISK